MVPYSMECKSVKTICGTIFALLVGTAGPLWAAPSNAPSPDEIRSTVKDAYIFTYPIVMNYRTMYMQAIKDDQDFGKWLHLELSSPADTDIVTPNNDTPYSYAWLDLRAEPWVLTMPKIEEDRYYTSQWDDLWGYVIDNPGSVNDGNEGYSYLFASPSWKGDVPKGIKRLIHGESDLLGTLTRTQVLGGSNDMLRVKEIQQSYKLQPLSSFAGTKAPSAAPAIDWLEWTEGDETKVKYFDYVNFLLPFTTPHPDDSALYEQMESLGLKAGAQWNSDRLDPATLNAFEQGIADARAELARLAGTIFDPADIFGTREKIGTDYINRALGVYVGIFGNVPEQAVYITTPVDSKGVPTDGSKNSYTITFPAGSLPPVKYFWSFTMYGLPDRLLVDNPINRYSIGSSTSGLTKNDNGSLTIYVSAKSPGKDRESNWLPAPEAPFWTVLRSYGPAPEIIDGTWKAPATVPQ